MQPTITNKTNLPPEIYKALCKNRYIADDEDSGQTTDYSVSAIISPVQQTILKRRYPGSNGIDCLDNVWTMFGSIAHQLLEEHGSDDAVTEKRLYLQVNGKTISGQMDHLKEKKITDYKTTSAYKITKKSYAEWEKQLNLYALLCTENGYPVESIRVIAIIRDWSEQESSGKNPDYPQAPIVVIPLLKWSRDAALRYLDERVQLLVDNEARNDDALTPCTDEERWMNTTGYAVMKKGAKRATRLFDNYLDAITDCNTRDPEFMVEQRVSEPRRCLKYCAASTVCKQHQDYLRQKEETA